MRPRYRGVRRLKALGYRSIKNYCWFILVTGWTDNRCNGRIDLVQDSELELWMGRLGVGLKEVISLNNTINLRMKAVKAVSELHWDKNSFFDLLYSYRKVHHRW